VVFESGYTSHNMVEESFGETTSPGDEAQLALWLTLEGYSEFLDDADRLVRSRILPSQILETPHLTPVSDAQGDIGHNLEQRIIGGYGGCHFHPHGAKRAVTDVTAADVHTLIDIYRHIAVKRGSTTEIFFHLDYEDTHVQITSRRAELRITPKQDTALSIRVPQWTPKESVLLQIENQPIAPVFAGHFVHTAQVAAGTTIIMEYNLPVRRVTEVALGITSEILWNGDEVIGIAPNTSFYPFYADISLS
jgi:hypothetical protein